LHNVAIIMSPSHTTTVGTNQQHAVPGDFRTETMWLRDHMGYSSDGKKVWSDLSRFYWTCLKICGFGNFKGVTCYYAWDRALVALEESAGIPPNNVQELLVSFAELLE
jgi:hypothetical protein